jgi:hypothetical protein
MVRSQDFQAARAFWCKKIAKSDRPYNMIFAVRGQGGLTMPDPRQLEGCAAVIEYWNGPAGLSIETQSNLELRYFGYMDMRKEAAPRILVPKARTIVSDNGDGVVSTFYWILSDMAKHLESMATEIWALEEALTTRGVLSRDEIDSHKGVLDQAHTSAKHMLVNVRHAISQLPD